MMAPTQQDKRKVGHREPLVFVVCRRQTQTHMTGIKMAKTLYRDMISIIKLSEIKAEGSPIHFLPNVLSRDIPIEGSGKPLHSNLAHDSELPLQMKEF